MPAKARVPRKPLYPHYPVPDPLLPNMSAIERTIGIGSGKNWVHYGVKRDNLWNWIAELSYDIRDTP